VAELPGDGQVAVGLVGIGGMVTVTLALPEPPGPVQEMEKVVLEVSAEEASDPDVAPPVSKPAALPAVTEQDVALADDHVIVTVVL
jgi:hypothetical protein